MCIVLQEACVGLWKYRSDCGRAPIPVLTFVELGERGLDNSLMAASGDGQSGEVVGAVTAHRNRVSK